MNCCKTKTKGLMGISYQ